VVTSKAIEDMPTQQVDWQEPLPMECRGGVVCIGNFDGVHLGHATLIAEARRQALALHGPAVALTFDPHPLDLLRPDLSVPVLTTTADRCRLLHELGADHVVVLRTTPGLLGLRAAEFFDKVVRQRLAARALVEGENFGFGRGREGNIQTLGQLCSEAGLTLTIVPALRVDGAEVSSSRVRTALGRGAVEEAGVLLGRPYRLHGTVGTGARRGQTIGFPTANLERLLTLAPGDGVYAVRAFTAGGGSWPAAANLGTNPTFQDEGRKIEVHLIGYHGDLYGQPLAVDILRRLRDTRRFAGVAELVDQLKQDVATAERVVRGLEPGT
jgi:riboflavin kinase/FMN adenylyltransferase